MAIIQTVNNGDSGFAARTKINNNDANINAAIVAAEALLATDNPSLDDFQKITDAIEAIQATLTVNDANYNTLQKITAKLKAAEATIATLGTAAIKNIGTAVGNVQENGATLGNSQTVETNATGKFITVAKNTAYNANFGTGNTDVARGDASYSKADTYTKTEINDALTTNSTNDRARANHTGEQAIATVTGLQTALDAKEVTANKGVANGYASLDSNAQVPLSQLPANAQGSKVVADIATRDVIATADRFIGLPVHVLDATADTTVTSGGAGYILKSGLSNTDWEKTYESESLDIDLSVYLNKTADTTDNIIEGTAKFTTQADIDKLAGIEAGATADQTAAEIKASYESNVDTNAYTDAEKNKLTGIEAGATADQSDLEIKSAYERNVNTNAFTDAEKNKLANLSKADVGLGNVDNTSDADKPISTAQQTALDAKLAKASNLSDISNRQTALDNLTDVANATNEYILTKDTDTGNAVFKPAPGGAGGTNLTIGAITGTTLDVQSDTGSNATVPAATPSNAGLLTSADKTKLDSVEPNATADQTAAEIKTAYEDNADTNAYTDAEKNKLAGINAEIVGKLPTGAVVMSIANSLTGALKFDGVSSYSKATYANLYALISAEVGTAFDIDANNFFLPDPAGRVLGVAGSGAGLTARNLFDALGAETHLLSVDEMPSHDHPLNVWSDSGTRYDVLVNGSDGNISVEADAINPAGGNQPHNNMQPTLFAAKNLFIYF